MTTHDEAMRALENLIAFSEHLLECSDLAPERNCSCHLSPPCNDCVEWAGLRLAREEVEGAIKTANALLATPRQEVAPVAMPLTDDEHEWLMYAVDHMLDDSEPEDKTCARVLQGLLDRCVVTSPAQTSEARDAVEREFASLMPGPYYMDPPDGGDVSVMEQFRRMAVYANRYRWLRAQNNDDFTFAVARNPHFDVYETPESLDSAIDAAMSHGGGNG